MKFEITQGCTAYNFTVDGKRYAEMTTEEKEKVIDHVLAECEAVGWDFGEFPARRLHGDSVSVTIINI